MRDPRLIELLLDDPEPGVISRVPAGLHPPVATHHRGRDRDRLAEHHHVPGADLPLAGRRQRGPVPLPQQTTQRRPLESTNPCESMIEIVRRTQRNVKRWSSGEMALRWTAAGMLEAERQFRKIIGYRDLATLVVAIERDHDRRYYPDAARTPTKEAAIVLTA